MEANPLLNADGLPAFSTIRPEHIEPALQATIDANRQQLDKILAAAASGTTDFDSAILPLEELGDRLGRVWGPVGHLHAVCNSPALREAYNRCLPLLSRYQTELAQDEKLWRLYRSVSETQDAESVNDSSGQAASVVQHALRDFHLAGVDLEAEKKDRFRVVAEELTSLSARFEQNVLDSMAAWTAHETNAKKLSGLPAWLLEQAAQLAKDESLDGWLFRLDQPTYVTVITHAENADIRQNFYRAWNTRASDQADFPADKSDQFDNTATMEQILTLRHELATLVGYENFAAYSLASKMATSVDEVLGFMSDLAEKSRAAAQAELTELEEYAGTRLNAWDIAFWSEKLREQKYSLSDEQLRPYFPLTRVMDGMFGVLQNLYGLKISRQDDVDVWHKDVAYFVLTDSNDEPIGSFYTDLFARPDKRSGAWMDECICRKNIGASTSRPVAHLVCNFARPSDQVPSLLTHTDVLTLFHEFGHTLHHLLTRIDYPSVAGINGVPWDAVELPSQFMENFAWQPDVLKSLSGHYQTDEPLPDALLDQLQTSRIFQAGLHMVRQLEFALFDLRLHAEHDPAKGLDVYGLLDEIRQQVAVVEQPGFNRFAHAFSHIFAGGYAAGYYSYKWAEVLAADAWSAFEEQGIFDQDVARRFRAEILEIGGTRDIGTAFAAFRGRPPRIEPLLKQAGITGGDR